MGSEMKGTEHSFHTWDVIIDDYDSQWGESFEFADNGQIYIYIFFLFLFFNADISGC